MLNKLSKKIHTVTFMALVFSIVVMAAVPVLLSQITNEFILYYYVIVRTATFYLLGWLLGQLCIYFMKEKDGTPPKGFSDGLTELVDELVQQELNRQAFYAKGRGVVIGHSSMPSGGAGGVANHVAWQDQTSITPDEDEVPTNFADAYKNPNE